MSNYYSLGEIDALARKATRGAGYSWGIAEEAGKATRWLSAYGLDGSTILAELLVAVSENVTNHVPELSKSNNGFTFRASHKGEGGCCPLYCGNLINDLGHQLNKETSLTFTKVLFPILSLPQVGRVAEAFQQSLLFTCSEYSIICTPEGISLKNKESVEIKESLNVVCSALDGVSDVELTHKPSPQNRLLSLKTVAVLEEFAHKTYAPATEESRLLGAGAGVNDND